MNYFQRFTFLFSAPNFDADDLEGNRVAQIIAAIGALPQTTAAQLMHQPTRESVAKAKMASREHIVSLLAKAKKQQAAGNERGCRATLDEVRWMLQ